MPVIDQSIEAWSGKRVVPHPIGGMDGAFLNL
jgi:hypothetical protein